MIGRSPIMSFDFGGLKIQEGFSTIPFKSINRGLRTVGASGVVLRIPHFYFSQGPNVRGGALLIKEGPTLYPIFYLLKGDYIVLS